MAERELSIILRLKDELSGSLKAVNTKLQDLNPTFNKMAIAGAAGFAAVSALAAKSTSDFSTFDKEIQRAGANVNATAEELAMFRRVAIEASRETGVAATEAGNALFWLAGGSISAEEASAALNETIKFATANQLSLEEAARQSAAAMTLFGIEADDIGHSLDVLTKAGQVSFATMDEISTAFSEAAPISAQLGVDMTDLVAIIGSFAEVGVKGTTAGVALKRAFTEILNPSKQMTEGLEALGLTAEDLQAQLNDPIALIGTLETALKDIEDPIEKARILAQTFGQISGPAMAALLGLGTDAIREMRDELTNSAGAMEDAFQRINEARSPMELLRNEMNLLSITLGQSLMEPLKNLLAAINPIIQRIAEWIQKNPELTANILMISGAVFGLLFVLGSLGKTVIGIAALFTTLAPLVVAVGTAFFALSLPMLIIIATIAALVAIGWYLYTNWDEIVLGLQVMWEEFKTFFVNLWNGIKDFFGETWEAIKAIAVAAIGALIAQFQPLIDIINTVKSAISSIRMPTGSFSIVNSSRKVNDALISPSGDIITTHPDDYIIATKNPRALGGGGGITLNFYGDVTGQEVVEKIKRALIGELKMQMPI